MQCDLILDSGDNWHIEIEVLVIYRAATGRVERHDFSKRQLVVRMSNGTEVTFGSVQKVDG